MESSKLQHPQDPSFGEALLCAPEFSAMDLGRKLMLLSTMRDICDQLLRYDILDLFYVAELSVSGRGFRCSYGFSGSRFDDPFEHRMRLSQVPDEVFESIALSIAMVEFCSRGQGLP